MNDVDAQARSSRSTWRFAGYEGMALIIVLLLCAITAVSLTHPGLLALTHSNVLGATFTTLSLLVAISAGFVALSEFRLYGFFSSLCIGLAFLLFAAGHVALRLVPLLEGWTHQVNWAPYSWGLGDSLAGVLFLAASMMTHRLIAPHKRQRAMTASLGLAALVAILVVLVGYQGGGTGQPQVTETPIPLLAAILYFTASVLFWRASKISDDQWFFWLSLSLTLAGFAELQYAIHQYPVNVVQPGDVLRLVFFSSILLALAAEWSVGYRRLRWQTQELEGFHALMTAPVIHDVGAVAKHIETVAESILHADARILVLGRVDPSSDEEDTGIAIPGTPTQRRTAPGGVQPEPGPNGLSLPLHVGNRRLGILIVDPGPGREFSADDLRLLRAFAAQASVLLERSLLYEETAAGAVLEERSRLAREIHDGLAQHLAFLKMRVAWLKRAPSSITEVQLQDMETVLETALIEARHAITTLRAGPQGMSPVEDILRYVEQFRQVSGLDVETQGVDDVPEIGPKARVELLRVVQEALNNVRKHAQAKHVVVCVEPDENGLQVLVTDDGRGFKADHELQGHFGLEIMHERADSIGATVSVSSEPGAGTTVKILVPSYDAEGHAQTVQGLGPAER